METQTMRAKFFVVRNYKSTPQTLEFSSSRLAVEFPSYEIGTHDLELTYLHGTIHLLAEEEDVRPWCRHVAKLLLNSPGATLVIIDTAACPHRIVVEWGDSIMPTIEMLDDWLSAQIQPNMHAIQQ